MSWKAFVTIESKKYVLALTSLTFEELKGQTIEVSKFDQQGKELSKVTSCDGHEIGTDQYVQQAFNDDKMEFIAYFQPSLFFKKFREWNKKDVSNERDANLGETQYCGDNKRKDTKIEAKNMCLETLDFNRHWSADWIKSNIEAAKIVEKMMNQNEQGLVVVVVVKDSSQWQKKTNSISIDDKDHVSSFVELANKSTVEKKQIGDYCVFLIKSRLIILKDVNIDGNVYAIDCEIQSEENAQITTQIFVTKNAIIDQKLKVSFSPIQWNTRIHHDIPLQIQNCQDQAEQHFNTFHSAEIIRILQNAVEISTDAFGLEHPYVANSYSNLGVAYRRQGYLEKAVECHEIALKICLKVFGDTHAWVSNLYNHFGVICDDWMRYEEAIEYHTKALNIRLQIFGSTHELIAFSYNHLGYAHDKNRCLEKAIECYEKELQVKLHIFGNNHASVAISYNKIGLAHSYNKQCDKAIEYYEKALQIRSQIFGNTDKSVGDTYWNLGSAFEEKQELKTASKYYEKSWRAYSIVLGEWDQETVEAKIKVNVTYWDCL
ncbi:hypothetical protein RFI_15696 [Reticulomyxa filosa]|uniref:Uncharacterized protein n=1 Tax=Reticulomyxa filosa TaxID=46433 RepID=X6N878_RETFI|nr:hypothetical protein RFI_15696 [Reticulomyxa filosa]|eukprot:ETO21507.1 hypothetical protein RFI_15696 [Reticulomyxa filosa]